MREQSLSIKLPSISMTCGRETENALILPPKTTNTLNKTHNVSVLKALGTNQPGQEPRSYNPGRREAQR